MMDSLENTTSTVQLQLQTMNSTEPLNKVVLDILRHTLQFVSFKDLINWRMVCKSWNAVITDASCLPSRGICKVTGNPASIEHFKKLSLPWKNFCFSKIMLEDALLGKQEVFRPFSLRYCRQLLTLQFDKVDLPPGRLFEVLAFCRNLKSLSIRNSPRIFSADFGLVHWKFCMPYVNKNLSFLEEFHVSVDKIDDETLGALVASMKSLQTFQIGTSAGPLPVQAIATVLRNNCGSLRRLELEGEVGPQTSPSSGLFPETLGEMKSLEHFKFVSSELAGAHVQMLENFLNKCPSLLKLVIVKASLAETTLSGVLPNLATLLLTNCNFGFKENAMFKNANFGNLEVLRVVQAEQMGPGTEAAISLLLGRKKPKLSRLDLRLSQSTGPLIMKMMPINYPKLTILSLVNCVGLDEPGLRHIFRHFSKLHTLVISHCGDITDASLCPTGPTAEEMKQSLANLKDLVNLNLSRSLVEGRAITECVVGNMPKLEFIILNQTRISASSIADLVTWAVAQSTALRHISASHCSMSLLVYAQLKAIAPQVSVNCRVMRMDGMGSNNGALLPSSGVSL